jgi:hypothetical protein
MRRPRPPARGRRRSLKTEQHGRPPRSPRATNPSVSVGTRGRLGRHQVVDVVLGLRSLDVVEGARRCPEGLRSPGGAWRRIPRKEVIQPQLPLRLPCYDFTPIADPTFDGCPPCGLAHRLRVLPTFVV